MKFGQSFNSNQVAAWRDHYLPYNVVKARLKIAYEQSTQTNTPAELGGTLNIDFRFNLVSGVNRVADFASSHYAFLKRKEDIFRNACRLPEDISTLIGNEPNPLDLIAYCDYYVKLFVIEELYRDFTQLLWFIRVNDEAISRILAKPTRAELSLSQDDDGEIKTKVELLKTHHRLCCKQIEMLQNVLDSKLMAYRTTLQSNPKLAIDLLLRSTTRDHSDDHRGRIFEHMVALKSLLNLQHESPENSPSGVTQTISDSQGKSLLLQVMTNLDNSAQAHILRTKDANGCTLLHYCAAYNLNAMYDAMVDILRNQDDAEVMLKTAILTTDMEGKTPLHHAQMNGNVGPLQQFVQHLKVHPCKEEHEHQLLSQTFHDLLMVSILDPNDSFVHLLAPHDAGWSSLWTNGETPLHIAAQAGRLDRVKLLLECFERLHLSKDVQDHAYGWTPLFVAAAEGHLDVVECLLNAEADQKLLDHRGWTIGEVAAFRGHGHIAQRLMRDVSIDLAGGPASTAPSRTRLPQFQLDSECSYLLIHLGSTHQVPSAPAVFIQSSLLENSQAQLQSSMELQFSTSPNKWSNSPDAGPSGNIKLPMLTDHIDSMVVISQPQNSSQGIPLYFRVTRADVDDNGIPTVIGNGLAILRDDQNPRRPAGENRESLVREYSVPILGKNEPHHLATVTFTYTIVRPFDGLKDPSPSIHALEKSQPVQLVGHRGHGMNNGRRQYLQLGENTVESLLSAAKLGASYVEFDVQLTRDLVPIIYHNFSLTETGTDVPIHQVTFDQFMHANRIQAPRGDPISILGSAKPPPEDGSKKLRRSRSWNQDATDEAEPIRERMKHAVHFSKLGFNANTRGDFIQGAFATLKEALQEVPQSISFDIELKYTRLFEPEFTGAPSVAIEINLFVDTVLTMLKRYAGTRSIVLSSFTPEICMCLALKQKAYPIMFITNVGIEPRFDMEYRAASLRAAVRFARKWGLHGLVVLANSLVSCPRLVRYIQRKGLICGTYGGINSEPGAVETQVKAGVDLIIADRVKLVSDTLKDVSAADRTASDHTDFEKLSTS